jgi:hypothetical protein
MSDPPLNLEDSDDNSPVTFAQVILTNKLYAEIVAEVTERIVAIRKICMSSASAIDNENPARPMFISIMRILEEDIDVDLFNLGDDDD